MSKAMRQQPQHVGIDAAVLKGSESVIRADRPVRLTHQYATTPRRSPGETNPTRGRKHQSSTPISLRLDENETRDLEFLMSTTGLNRSDALRLALREVAEIRLTARLREQSELSRNEPAEARDRAEVDELLPSIGLYDDAPEAAE